MTIFFGRYPFLSLMIPKRSLSFPAFPRISYIVAVPKIDDYNGIDRTNDEVSFTLMTW
jgi:hypothetical protein